MHDSMRRKVVRFLLNTFECFTQRKIGNTLFACTHSWMFFLEREAMNKTLFLIFVSLKVVWDEV